MRLCCFLYLWRGQRKLICSLVRREFWGYAAEGRDCLSDLAMRYQRLMSSLCSVDLVASSVGLEWL